VLRLPALSRIELQPNLLDDREVGVDTLHNAANAGIAQHLPPASQGVGSIAVDRL
jgi:hypothetical protein